MSIKNYTKRVRSEKRRGAGTKDVIKNARKEEEAQPKIRWGVSPLQMRKAKGLSRSREEAWSRGGDY